MAKSPDDKTLEVLDRTPSYAEGQILPHDALVTQRGIKSRHAQMMAIGGTIGTGLFVGVGEVLALAGPANIFLAYITICIIVYAIITATNEMNTYLPFSGCSMAAYGTRFVSPSLGFAMGLLYWYSFGIIIAYEITAAALVINYWSNPVPLAVWITLMIVVVVALNFFPVKIYGESEFWFASLKVFLIIGLLILSFVLFLGGGPNQHTRLGFHYWNHPGAFNTYLVSGPTGRFCAYLYTLCYSVFSFNFAPELLVIAAGEMHNPRKNLPRAAKQYFYRLIIFYILGVLAIGVICPSNASGLTDGTGVAASPWVIAIKRAGIHGLDSVVNAVIITSAWSSANSYLYMSSRTLYSLARAGNAPKIFTRCTRHGVPYYAVLCSSLFSLLAYMDCSSGASTAFNWFVSLTNTAGFTSWTCCGIIFLRFRAACNAQGLKELPYRSRLQPWMGIVATLVCPVLLLCNGFQVFFHGHWSVSSFLTSYIGLFVFLVVYAAHRVVRWRDGWWIPAEQVDLVTGLEEVEALEVDGDEEEKKGWWRKLWE